MAAFVSLSPPAAITPHQHCKGPLPPRFLLLRKAQGAARDLRSRSAVSIRGAGRRRLPRGADPPKAWCQREVSQHETLPARTTPPALPAATPVPRRYPVPEYAPTRWNPAAAASPVPVAAGRNGWTAFGRDCCRAVFCHRVRGGNGDQGPFRQCGAPAAPTHGTAPCTRASLWRTPVIGPSMS